MKAETIFNRLWTQYAGENPSAGKIHELFKTHGNEVINDHIAFRTLDDPRINIEVLAKPFIAAGYVAAGDYEFKAKKLRATHFELPGDPKSPRVFISELKLDELSEELRSELLALLDGVDESVFNDPELISHGSIFPDLSYERYCRFREESEYAAWLYVFGFRANHFTVSINYLEGFEGIVEVNEFLKSNGYPMNSSGGEIKGSPEKLLEQSSTLADQVEVKFIEGHKRIPSCYYEFARRYEGPDGKIFSGFIADSADKIFESTDYRT